MNATKSANGTEGTFPVVRKLTDLAGLSEQYEAARDFGAECVHHNGGLIVATDKQTGLELWRCIDLREWQGKQAEPYCFSIAFNTLFFPQLLTQ